MNYYIKYIEIVWKSKGLFTPSEKANLLKQVSSLNFKLKQAEKKQERYHNMWLNLQSNRWSEDFKRTDLKIQVADLIAENSAIRQELATLKATLSLDPDASSKMTALEDEIIRLNAIINNDGSNSGTPTSQTPLNKNKVIPNSREKTVRSKGGQLEHEKHSLASFVEREITDTTTSFVSINRTRKLVCGFLGNEFQALLRLTQDKPYSVQELLYIP